MTNGLQLRVLRAFEHWPGNTHLTMAAIILRNVEQNMQLMAAIRRHEEWETGIHSMPSMRRVAMPAENR